jgi:hypothetical protein
MAETSDKPATAKPASPAGGSGPDLVRALNALGRWRAIAVVITTVLAAYWLALAVTFGIVPVGPGLTNRLGGVAPGDFMFFYPAAVLAGRGDAALVYDPAALTAEGRATLGRVPELVWPYPPTMSLPLALLGQFSPGVALVIWIAVAVGSLALLARLALGEWRLTPLALLFPASALALFTGQFSPVLALLLGVFFMYSTAAPALSGAALGLLVWKPHFGIAPAALVVTNRWWRVVVAAAATGLTVVAISVAAFGTHTWVRFFEAASRHSSVLTEEVPLSRFVSAFAAAATNGLAALPALVIHAILLVPLAIVGLHLWRNGSRPHLRALGLIGTTILVTPYALDYDLVFLLLPWLLMIREAREDAGQVTVLFWPWMGLTFLAPATYMVQLYTGRSIGGPCLLGVMCLSWWQNRQQTASSANWL